MTAVLRFTSQHPISQLLPNLQESVFGRKGERKKREKGVRLRPDPFWLSLSFPGERISRNLDGRGLNVPTVVSTLMYMYWVDCRKRRAESGKRTNARMRLIFDKLVAME